MSITFTAGRGDSRRRLDQIVAERVTSVSRMSRTLAQRWIEDGHVLVDGVRATRSSARVRTGSCIAVTPPSSTTMRQTPQPEPMELDILYEDDDLIAVNKPAGMVVHPSFRNPGGTLLNGVLWRFRESTGERLGLVSRLDKDTSGLLIVARSAGTHAQIQRDARLGRVRKEYLAVVHGVPHPAEDAIRLPLARDPSDRRRVVVSPDGAPSETRYRVVTAHQGGALVACELVTGRTHQIRVHLSARGCPIVGDRVYGSAHGSIARQALHAARLTLPHPRSGQSLTLEAPLPADMRSLLEDLGPAAE